MARRNQNTIDFSGYYNEPEVNPITMAMQLLGMEDKERESKTANLMAWMQHQDEQQRAEEELGLKRETLGETRLGNVEARRLAQAQEERLGRESTEKSVYNKTQQDIERQKLIASALEKVAGVPQLSEEAKLLISNIPGMAEPYQQMVNKRELGAVTPQLQAAYANKDAAKRDAAIRLLYGQMSPYARENVNWQDLNQLIPPEKPGIFSGPPPAVAPPPGELLRPAFGNYGPIGPQPVIPPYQYGVGTRR